MDKHRSDDVLKRRNAAIAAAGRRQRWRQALQLFHALPQGRLQPNARSYGAAMGAQRTQWVPALALLRQMSNAAVEGNIILYSAASTACEQGQTWPCAVKVLDTVRRHSVELDARRPAGPWACAVRGCAALREEALEVNVIVLNTALAATRWALGLGALGWASRGSLQVDRISFNSLIGSCRDGPWQAAAELTMDMRARGLRGNRITSNAVMASLSDAKCWQRALGAFEDLPCLRQHLVGAALKACEQGAKWQAALSLLAAVNDVANYTAAMRACAAATRWDVSLALLADLVPSDGLRLDTVAVNAAIAAAAQGVQWTAALALWAELPSLHLGASAATHGAALDALGKGRQWQRAVHLLSRVVAVRGPLSILAYNAAISACEGAERWEAALALFADLPQQALRASIVTCNAAASACAEGRQWQAHQFIALPSLRRW
ncbi:unnamed protein product [Symbiodinium natans]|uniref:Pentatricopeptide repeat-containing protein, chloroplastic n=1 Tax=Symbiodinium natans TaxID=878477 RepID=A0A812KRP5_9DINO|nr:unnamed protein product [Symbiodinium natans]